MEDDCDSCTLGKRFGPPVVFSCDYFVGVVCHTLMLVLRSVFERPLEKVKIGGACGWESGIGCFDWLWLWSFLGVSSGKGLTTESMLMLMVTY